MRAVPEQTEAMNSALIAAGNPPEGMIIQSGEMHGFYKEENNLKLYTEMLNFFARHIGGTGATGTAAGK
jgi:dipeptidyl aminopeptidase/acylaminoacyl peptidase